MFIEYIFNPEKVNDILLDYTEIRKNLGNPIKEGKPSDAF